MRRRLAAATFIASMLFTLATLAQEGGQDEVTLKNGGIVRGTVVSSEPGTSVKIIEMGQKEVRVIPWAQVSDVERGKYAPKAVAQPGPSGPGYGMAPPLQTPAPEPKLGAPGVVRLHVASPVPAQVIEHVGTTVGGVGGYTVIMEQLRPVCTAPCGTVVDGSKGQAFAVTGSFPTPKPFTLDGYSGDVTAYVDPGSNGLRLGGGLAILFGALSLATGAVILPLGVIEKKTPLTNAGIGTLVGGGVALAGGIVMVVLGKSKLKIEPGPPGAGPRVGAVQPRYWMGQF